MKQRNRTTSCTSDQRRCVLAYVPADESSVTFERIIVAQKGLSEVDRSEEHHWSIEQSMWRLFPSELTVARVLAVLDSQAERGFVPESKAY